MAVVLTAAYQLQRGKEYQSAAYGLLRKYMRHMHRDVLKLLVKNAMVVERQKLDLDRYSNHKLDKFRVCREWKHRARNVWSHTKRSSTEVVFHSIMAEADESIARLTPGGLNELLSSPSLDQEYDAAFANYQSETPLEDITRYLRSIGSSIARHSGAGPPSAYVKVHQEYSTSGAFTSRQLPSSQHFA